MAPFGTIAPPVVSYSRSSSVDVANKYWSDEIGANADQLFFISCYSDFEKLAHGPRGKEAAQSIYVYRFHPADGSMVLLNMCGDPSEVMNPAFSRFHPRLNVVYTCTEDISNNGQIIAYQINPEGDLVKLSQVDAGGTSTCYLTIDKAQQNLLAVNYWDSTLAVIPISYETGELIGGVKSLYDPKGGLGMKAAPKKDGGVNHSNNDMQTIKMRQVDPHSHALVLDPYVGTVAYVPCLGKDLVREFYYDKTVGKIEVELNSLPSGLCTGHPDGPRYVAFHPIYNVMYVVNELSSTVAVFSVDKNLLRQIDAAAKNGESIEKFKGKTTLKLIQSIGVIPNAFPKKMNTCGRISVHQSGRFVLVSNRGHQSIAILRVKDKGPQLGQLTVVGYFHTRGETPRHFQFDSSGQYLIVANQDTNNIAIFNFNQCSGEIKFTGNDYRVPSPNFICCCPLRDGGFTNSIISSDGGFVLDKEESSVSDSGSEYAVDPSRKQLEEQLMKAHREIDELKKMLTALSVSQNTSISIN